MKRASQTIVTVLSEPERSRIDAAAGHGVVARHVRSVLDANRAVREVPVQAVLVSPQHVAPGELPAVSRLVRDFPEVRVAAVLLAPDVRVTERVFQLAVHGVTSLLDLSRREGWHRLRDFVGRAEASTAARMTAGILEALDHPNDDVRRFFDELGRCAPFTTTARRFILRFGVCPSTLTSRFHRAYLPSPKQYLAAARLVHGAALLENQGLSITDVAYRLNYSSPQSFSRHVRNMLGLTGSTFRVEYDFARTLVHFVDYLVRPHRITYRSFHPFDIGIGAPGLRGNGRYGSGESVSRSNPACGARRWRRPGGVR